MNFMKFTIISTINKDDMMEIEIDLDTIDDDEPQITLLNETLDIGDDGNLCHHSQKFIDAYNEDDLFLQCIWDIHDKTEGYTLDRGEYIIQKGG